MLTAALTNGKSTLFIYFHNHVG